jgi:Domain of unknown function (DUF3846)
LQEMQKCVEGYIEAIRLTPELVMYVNEDGTMKDLPLNSRATAKLWEHCQQHRGRTYIVGDVLVASLEETGDKATEQQPEQCEVCEKTEGPFIKVEVSDGESDPQWLAVCGEACLQQVILRWKQIGEIVRPQ